VQEILVLRDHVADLGYIGPYTEIRLYLSIH
jgi:hypothetical protein